jgi:hypothetical protein
MWRLAPLVCTVAIAGCGGGGGGPNGDLSTSKAEELALAEYDKHHSQVPSWVANLHASCVYVTDTSRELNAPGWSCSIDSVDTRIEQPVHGMADYFVYHNGSYGNVVDEDTCAEFAVNC